MTLKKSMLIRIFIVKSKNNVGNPENIFTRLCKVVLQIYLVQLKRGNGSIKEKRENEPFCCSLASASLRYLNAFHTAV